METHSYSFAGLSDVYEMFMMDMAGAAEIPATKLFGRSPQGLNATGEADLKNYYEMIAQLQERVLRPALEKLMPVMAVSCWGYVPEDLEIVFSPVMTTSAMDRAELEEKLTGSVIKAFQAGLIGKEEAVEELAGRGVELGMWTRLRTGDSGEEFALRAVEVLPSRVSPKDGKIQEGKRWNKMVNEGAPWNRKEKDGMRMEY